MKYNVKAHHIKWALARKHERLNDFFLTEVKNGPTHIATDLYILDAVAIKKSWVNPCITGYEIKVSRNDFLQDEKWPAYKNYCHRLDFVCPKGLIRPEELPDDIGLIYYNPEKDTLHTRRKGKIRNIEMPYEMLYYIIMTRLDNERHPFFNSKREYFEEYIRDKIDTKTLAFRVRTKLITQVEKMEYENDSLKRELEQLKKDSEILKKIADVLDKYGIGIWRKQYFHEEIDEALRSSIPPHLVRELETIKNASNRIYDLIKNN